MRTFKGIRSALEKSFLQNPLITEGRLLPDGISITKAVSCPQEDKVISNRQLYLSTGTDLRATKIVSTPDSTVTFEGFDSAFDFRVVVRQAGDEESIVEVHRNDSIVFKKSLKDKHGPINVKPQFNQPALCFHPSKRQCVYLAETKPKAANLFVDEFKADNLKGNEYKHSFGETCETYNLGIFILDFQTNSVFRVKGLPDDIIPITVRFVAGEKDRLLITAFDKTRHLSGINMCFNKPSSIQIIEDFELEDLFPPESKKPEDKDKTPAPEKKATATVVSQFHCTHFPSASPSGKYVTYLFSRNYNEAHIFTTGLAVWADGKTEVIVDSEEEDGQLAIYAYYNTFARMWWLSEEEFVFPSYEKGTTIINLVHVANKTRRKIAINKDFQTDGVELLDVNSSTMLFSLNNLYHRGRVGICHTWRDWWLRDRVESDIIWEQKQPSEAESEFRIPEGQIEEVKIGIRDVEGFLWRVKGVKDDAGNEVPPSKRPLFIDFHGGPHWFKSAVPNELSELVLKHHMQVMTMNFSGSWSYGKKFNERICGQIGVIDIKELIDWLDANKDLYDPDQVYFHGGSYSGMQSIVLFREYGRYFKAIICKNPALNQIAMLFQTDIPEWIIVETQGAEHRFDITKDPTDEQLARFKKHSPALQPFDPNTKTKLLLILGDSDKRCPPSQSYYLFKKLKALGLDVRCLVYKGQGHGIRKPKFVLDFALNIFDIIFDFEAQEKLEKEKADSKKVEQTTNA